jgi:hypothetical protein
LSAEQRYAGVDKYGIKKLYPDADDEPEQQYLDMNDIKAGRVDDYPATYEESDEDVPGGFKAIEIGGVEVRLALYSSNGNPFGSVEHTVYFKFETETGYPTSNGATMTIHTGSSNLTLAEASTTTIRIGAVKETR